MHTTIKGFKYVLCTNAEIITINISDFSERNGGTLPDRENVILKVSKKQREKFLHVGTVEESTQHMSKTARCE